MQGRLSKGIFTLAILALLSISGSAQVVGPAVRIPFTGGGGGSSSLTTAAFKDATYCTSATGTDAYACTLTTAPANLAAMEGVVVSFRADVANTGAATVAFNGFAATPIVKVGLTVTAALVTGDIRAGDLVTVRYDGTSFSCLSCDGLRASTGIVQSWTAAQTFAGFTSSATATINSDIRLFIGTTNGGALAMYTAMTPDAPGLLTGSLSGSWHVYQNADAASDFGNGRCLTSACAAPSFIVHSSDVATTEYAHISADTSGAAGFQSNFAELRVGGTKTAITEGSAQAIVRFGIPTSTNVFGATVFYTVYDINGANYTSRSGQVRIQGGNSGGTATCTINVAQDTEAEDGSQIATSNAATLTYTWTNVVSTTNCDLSLNATSSQGANTYAITWTAVVMGNSNAITVVGQ